MHHFNENRARNNRKRERENNATMKNRLKAIKVSLKFDRCWNEKWRDELLKKLKHTFRVCVLDERKENNFFAVAAAVGRFQLSFLFIAWICEKYPSVNVRRFTEFTLRSTHTFNVSRTHNKFMAITPFFGRRFSIHLYQKKKQKWI